MGVGSEEVEVPAAGPIESVRDALLVDFEGPRPNLRVDVDLGLLLRDGPALRAALYKLLRIALDTAPPAGEIFLAAARPGAALVRIGAARLVVRWQVADSVADAASPGVVGIRPGVRGAASIAGSEEVYRLVGHFERIGWRLSLEPTRDGKELLALASHRGGA